jgi:ribosome biogenesis GTPase / thiamine phosphate phosphatase
MSSIIFSDMKCSCVQRTIPREVLPVTCKNTYLWRKNIPFLKEGIVIKSTGSLYLIRTGSDEVFPCKIKGSLRTKSIKSTNPVAVGDHVRFSFQSKDQYGIISEILDRKNYIIRRSSNLSRQTHVIAANIDQALLIVTITRPRTTLRFIDRFLLTAEAYRIPAILVFNKIDLYGMEEKAELASTLSIYEKIGYPCLKTSALTGQGMEDFNGLLSGKVSLLSGNSGVGKSSLINYIEPSLNLKTEKISDFHLKGKHTTTFSEMHKLSNGGYIIDTPGIKGFGLVNMDKDEIFHFFPEIFKISHQCKYYNCLHINEPGCAIMEALKNNQISLSRYESYYSIFMEDQDEKYR